MFGLFKKQLVTLNLPHDLRFFSVRDQDETLEYEQCPSGRKIAFTDPIVKLTPRVRKIFDICDVEIDMRFEYRTSVEVQRFVVEYSESAWDNTTKSQKCDDLQLSVLKSKIPYFMVPSKKLLDLERALDHLKREFIEEENDV